MSLHEIVQREFAPYDGGNVEIDGPHVELKAEAAQAMAMVLHELATNAAKYGAFSNRSGRVPLRWRWLRNGSSGRLAIEWQEIGGPQVLAAKPNWVRDERHRRACTVRAQRQGRSRLCSGRCQMSDGNSC